MSKTNSLSIVIAFAFVFHLDLYSISFYNSKGTNFTFAQFIGKPIMVVTLPTKVDSAYAAFFETVNQLATNMKDNFVVVAVPAYEDGFNHFNKNELYRWYESSLSPSVIISEAIYTRKSSGGFQHDLFKWLTTKELNLHLDTEITGPCQKFLINTSGDLVAAFNSKTGYEHQAFQKAVELSHSNKSRAYNF